SLTFSFDKTEQILKMRKLRKHVPFAEMYWVGSNATADQLGRVALLSGILFIMLGFGSDGVPPLVQLRTPPSSITGLPNLPSSLGGYSYTIMKLGPLQFTRKGLSVARTPRDAAGKTVQ
ncbi:Protein ABCI12, chloroplastic, partial [Ananas comosus]